MSKKSNWNKRTSITLQPVLLLAACSSFVQPPAPVENPSTVTNRPINADTRTKTAEPTTTVAQALPYQPSAPVQQADTATVEGKTYVVQPGDTLFRIALKHGVKYQDIAKWNTLPADYTIQTGQVLRLTPSASSGTPVATTVTTPATTLPTTTTSVPIPDTVAVKQCPKGLKLPYSDEAVKQIAPLSEGKCALGPARVTKQASSAPKGIAVKKRDASTVVSVQQSARPETSLSSKPKTHEDNVAWIWPTEGKILRAYSENNKGIDIGGQSGQPVLAAGPGKVVYSGNGLRGYGNLIIIKHNKAYLSAYANNSQLLVKEGQSVKQGQKIAEMGNTDADRVKLHFEIRRFGKPVDPMQYLESKP